MSTYSLINSYMFILAKDQFSIKNSNMLLNLVPCRYVATYVTIINTNTTFYGNVYCLLSPKKTYL